MRSRGRCRRESNPPCSRSRNRLSAAIVGKLVRGPVRSFYGLLSSMRLFRRKGFNEKWRQQRSRRRGRVRTGLVGGAGTASEQASLPAGGAARSRGSRPRELPAGLVACPPQPRGSGQCTAAARQPRAPGERRGPRGGPCGSAAESHVHPDACVRHSYPLGQRTAVMREQLTDGWENEKAGHTLQGGPCKQSWVMEWKRKWGGSGLAATQVCSESSRVTKGKGRRWTQGMWCGLRLGSVG